MQIGDHLVTPRTGYTHHGLYLGNQQVIHYSGKSRHDQGSIQQVTLEEFCDGNSCRVRDYPFRVYGRKESVERAYERLGEASYSILFNNCEQFVAWCIMGFGYSEQLNDVVRFAIETQSLAETVAHRNGQLLLQSVMTSETTKELVSHALPMSGAVTTAALVSGSSTGTALVAGGLSIASMTPLAVPMAAGAIVGYGVKKLIDWVW